MRTYKEWLERPEGEPEQDIRILIGLPEQDTELVPADEVSMICNELKGEV